MVFSKEVELKLNGLLFFEKMNFDFEYEPFDLNSYIPDFVITFSNGKELLVEIKATMNIWIKSDEYEVHIDKIRKSGWTKPCIILGGNYENYDNNIRIGIYDELPNEEELGDGGRFGYLYLR